MKGSIKRSFDYFTINTGHDIHLICQKHNVEELCEKLERIKEVKRFIVNRSAVGVRLTKKHLF